MPDWLQYGALGLLAAVLVGLYALLRPFVQQIGGALATTIRAIGARYVALPDELLGELREIRVALERQTVRLERVLEREPRQRRVSISDR